VGTIQNLQAAQIEREAELSRAENVFVDWEALALGLVRVEEGGTDVEVAT